MPSYIGLDSSTPFLIGAALHRNRTANNCLNVLEPMPITHRQRSIIHPLQLHLVPLLQVINFVLALLHALVRRLIVAAGAVLLTTTATTTATLAHHLRHFFPIPTPQIPPTQLVKLLRVRLQKARDRRVAPLLSVLPVISAAAVTLRPAQRFTFVVVVVIAAAVVSAGIVPGGRAGFQLLVVIWTRIGGRRSSDAGSGDVRVGVFGERRREVIAVSGVSRVVARGRVEAGIVVDEREVLGSHGKKRRERLERSQCVWEWRQRRQRFRVKLDGKR